MQTQKAQDLRSLCLWLAGRCTEPPAGYFTGVYGHVLATDHGYKAWEKPCVAAGGADSEAVMDELVAAVVAVEDTVALCHGALDEWLDAVGW